MFVHYVDTKSELCSSEALDARGDGYPIIHTFYSFILNNVGRTVLTASRHFGKKGGHKNKHFLWLVGGTAGNFSAKCFGFGFHEKKCVPTTNQPGSNFSFEYMS